jgi:type II secretory pathway component GspD/PulD (secretin)
MKINEKFGGHPDFGIPPQLLRIMKLTTIIMMMFLMQVSALTKAQITLKEKGTSLQKVLENISKQSGYDLVYSNLDFKNAKPVTLDLNDVSVESALQSAFNGQPLIYEVSEKTIMIKKKEEKSYLETIIARFQAIDVRGVVIDENNQYLAGATVRVKGGKGTTLKVSFLLRMLRKVQP